MAKAIKTAPKATTTPASKALLSFTVPVRIALEDIYVAFDGKSYSKNANVHMAEELPLPGDLSTTMRANIGIPRALLSDEAWQGAMARGRARYEAKNAGAVQTVPGTKRVVLA